MAEKVQGNYSVSRTAGSNFTGTLLSKLPFSYQIIDNISSLNPKYEIFDKLSIDKQERINKQSVYVSELERDMTPYGDFLVDKNYQQYMYANIDMDKIRRIGDYRRMANYQYVSDAIDEICDEVFPRFEDGSVSKLKFSETPSNIMKDELNKEFTKFISHFNFEVNGWKYCRKMVTDGELFFENIISPKEPHNGILGVLELPTELCNPIYKNCQNGVLEGFTLRKPVYNDRTKTMEKEEFIILNNKQVTYVHSDLWNEDSSVRLPYIERARRAYKQLSMVEDLVLIYRLARTPERLVFKVDTGNMSGPKQEHLMRRMSHQITNKKVYDNSTGRTTNTYDPPSPIDSYWFGKRTGTDGVSVENITSSANFGTLDDLYYFLKALYRSLAVPTGRLNPETGFKDGADMPREEIKFANFILRLQTRFSEGIKQGFITHLKLRNIWSQYNLRERDVDVSFQVPTVFMAMKQQQLFDIKYNNFSQMANVEGISPSFSQRHYLGLNDKEMAENREWRRKDAAFMWELEQIQANGPNFREMANAANEAAGEMESQEAGAPMGGNAGGAEGNTETPPDFGPAPTGGEGASQSPAGGEGTPVGGQQAAPAGGQAGGQPNA